ncbi:histidine kinase [Cytophagales bacterium LB-30]|uniref:Histidine kinase n=1 Tax=Shiella aurantiaca TaxID=3058365 RepID=A0ABT8F5B6_9BACT|nr:histidine kinase [Shiella aurantiaca]MDN4165645.1 histidine kinase [Shiella aurantiaca]
MKLSTCLLVVCICLVSPWVSAQQPYAISINQSVGLPTNSVYNLLQDSKGYIWIAHNEGLSRYDGFEFKTFESVLQTSKAGSSLKEDSYGRIWYENFDGFVYYAEQDTLKMLTKSKPIGYYPMGITQKHVFLVKQDGLEVFDAQSLAFQRSMPIDVDGLSHTLSDASSFYLINDTILYQIDSTLHIKAFELPSILDNSEKHLYFLNNQVVIVQKSNRNKNVYALKEDSIELLFEANGISFIQGAHYIDSSYWLLSPQGAFQFENGRQSIHFSEKNLSFLLKDYQGNYWFSTVDEGIILVPNIHNQIKNLDGEAPYRIVPAGEGYLISTKNGQIIHLSKDLKQTTLLHKDKFSEGIHYLYLDSANQNQFYVSKDFGLIPRGDYRKRITQELALKEMYRIDEKYYAFAATGPSGLFISPTADSNSPSLWDSIFQTNRVDKRNYASLLSQSRGKSVVYLPDREEIYFASNLGLFKTGLRNSKELKYENNSLFLSKLTVYKDILYGLSTKGNLFSIENESVRKINADYDIPEGDIIKIRQFGKWLFVMSKKSLELIDVSQAQVKPIPIDVDVKIQEINDILLDNDQLLLLTNEGIIRLEFSIHKEHAEVPKFYINSLKVNNQKKDFYKPQTLDFDQNNVEINYSLLQYYAGVPSKVFYQMNAEDWQPISSETRTLSFPALAPGKYSLRFRVDNTPVEPLEISFEIKPPFWMTLWFLAICIIILFAFAYWYYRWQTGVLIKQNQLLKEKIVLEQTLSKSMLTSIKSQMNPHFFYNALNTIQAYIFSNDKRNASNYLAKFSKLTRMILEMSEKETIYLQEEVMALNLYLELEKMRFSDDFNYSITLEESIDTDMVKIPSMLIQPYVENAVKHGLLHKKGEKHVKIAFHKQGEVLKVIVSDNGIGRKRSEELNKIKQDKYQSFSSTANEKRLELLNRGKTNSMSAQIIDEYDPYGQALGTRVELIIPIS